MSSIDVGKTAVSCGAKHVGTCTSAWDHLPGTVKLGDVSTMIGRRPREFILQEIAKCDLVCLNCHALRTLERRSKKRQTP